MRSDRRPVTLTALLLLLSLTAVKSMEVGLNWGSASSNLLPPDQAVSQLLLANAVTRVRLSDADPGFLQSLSGLGFRVTIGIRNEMLVELSGSKKKAESWVHDNVTRYLGKNGFGGVRIEYIAIGDDPFNLNYNQQYQPFVIGAASNIYSALKSAKLSDRIKLIVPISSDAYQTDSNLPSKARFRPDLNKTMIELLSFLSNHSSPFVLDLNPFSSFQQSKNLSLDFHLFELKSHPLVDLGRKYFNYFDMSIDCLVTCLDKLGFGDLEIMVGKIGWPTDGALNATSANAQIFMQGLINHLKEKNGTPLRPKRNPIETYLFSLLDEDKLSIKNGNYERHYGIFTFDGQAKYNVDLGQGSKSLKNAHDVNYLALKWCVLNNNKDNIYLNNISDYISKACLEADCTDLSTGGSCSTIGWPGNVSYVFNNYYQSNGQDPASCDFGGLGLVTTVDPSDGECRFNVGLQVAGSDWIVERVVLFWRVVLMSACLFVF